MSSVMICDKCGMSCGDVAKFMHIRAHKMNSVERHSVDTVNKIDVCIECYEKIFNIKRGDK